VLFMPPRTIRHCRRDAAMQRQRDARRDLTSHARVLALGGNGGDHDGAGQVGAEAADGAMAGSGRQCSQFPTAETKGRQKYRIVSSLHSFRHPMI